MSFSVHEMAYIQHLHAKCDASYMAQHNIKYPQFYSPLGNGLLDTDTPINPLALDAAKLYCGYVIYL
jgi:acetoin utilization deacetylase AcuC-like enzyme